MGRLKKGRLKKGVVLRPTRGIYILATPTENQSLVEACLRVPHEIVCLLGPAVFSSHNAESVRDLAGHRSQGPSAQGRLSTHSLRRFSGSDLTEGLEEHRVQQKKIRVTRKARCFSFARASGSASMSHSKPLAIATARSWRRWDVKGSRFVDLNKWT